MPEFSIIGCGYVADLYMRSLALHPGVRVGRVFDRDGARLAAFAAHWKLPAAPSAEAFLEGLAPGSIVLNLTSPAAHFEVSRALLERGCHVYSEKPLALRLEQARTLHDLARERGLQLASAPCSLLGEAAQTLGRALRDGVAGTPRLVYAELDDGFIPQAPLAAWQSESGAPWPAADEFATGCTLEHAGYYLSWLIGFFGPVTRLTACAAELLPGKAGGGGAPDFSTAVLQFAEGPVARLTCSIIAPHDHRIRVIGDRGVLAIGRAWDNGAPLRFHRRFTLRRRLLEMPLGRRLRLRGATHPKPGRRGAAAMNFALGPMELAEAVAAGRRARLGGDFALHLNEVTLAIQNAGPAGHSARMTTSCARPEPMPWAR